MTIKLEDLVKSFSNLTNEEQFAKIREIRDRRSIERPSVAKKRKKKEVQKGEKLKDKARQLVMGLSDMERDELIKKLQQG